MRADSQQPALREADHLLITHDDVVEHADVDEAERIAQAVREPLVGVAWLGDSRRMIVGVLTTLSLCKVFDKQASDWANFRTRLLVAGVLLVILALYTLAVNS